MNFTQFQNKEASIGIIGLGYVGLPLATLFATKFKVFGFDIDAQRVKELQNGVDRTHEVLDSKKINNENITYSTDPSYLKKCPLIIVTVPTPVDSFNKPDLHPLLSASETVGKHITKGSLVVYESTVYPGCTEKDCGKVIEKFSGLKFKEDFDLGYSPERVNPGDREHTIDKIIKVVSASSASALNFLEEIYGSVITAGIHKAPSIGTAEAAKVIENTQRDLNIALINELALIFDRCGLDTQDVLAAARTKWNFLPFYPGLVGGHCIGVDPFYLTYMAEGLGFHPQTILAGRRINDAMGDFVAQKTMKLVLNHQEVPSEFNIAVMGITFKENVPDLRNTKVMDIVDSLENYGAKVHCIDPICDPNEFEKHYKRNLVTWKDLPSCDAVILATKHSYFVEKMPLEEITKKLKGPKVLVDVKGIYDRTKAAALGMTLWRL